VLEITVAGEKLIVFLAANVLTFKRVVNRRQFTLDLSELRKR
jgi:hypothetical protein